MLSVQNLIVFTYVSRESHTVPLRIYYSQSDTSFSCSSDFSFGHWEVFQLLRVPLTPAPQSPTVLLIVFLSTSLLSGPAQCPRLILHTPHLQQNQPFLQEVLLPGIGGWDENLDLDPRCAHCYRALSAHRARTCMSTPTQSYKYFVCIVFIYVKLNSSPC